MKTILAPSPSARVACVDFRVRSLGWPVMLAIHSDLAPLKGRIVTSPNNANDCTYDARYRVLSSKVRADGAIWVQSVPAVRAPHLVPASHFGL